jgi:hypothetical protein
MSDVHDDYVAGDVNTIDDEGDEYDEVDDRRRGQRGWPNAAPSATASPR